MGDEDSPTNSCPSSPSLADKMSDAGSQHGMSNSPVALTRTTDSVTKEEDGPLIGNNGSPSSTHGQHKPSAPLSFSIARLINKVPNDSPAATSDRPSVRSSSDPPVYPIPMWPPTSTSSRGPAFPATLPSYGEPSFNQMLRTVLMHHQTGLPTDALAALMRHYQQQFYSHPPAGLFHHPVAPAPLNLSATAAVAAANLHKVEILRSAATASLQHRPLSIGQPHGIVLLIGLFLLAGFFIFKILDG